MSKIPRHSPQEVHQLVTEQGYVHIDVRTQAEYEAGHPAGALNIPSMLAGPAGMTPNPEFERIVNALFPKDAKIVVGCRSGARSLRAAELLTHHGYTAIVDQRAGFEGSRDPSGRVIEAGWGGSGLPVEKVTPGGSYAEIKAKVGG